MNTPEQRAAAIATLATLIEAGDTVFLIRRGANLKDKNKIVDVRLQSQPAKTTAGELIGAAFGKPYVFSRSGLILRPDEPAETIIQLLSAELFGAQNQIKMVWI